MNDSEMRLLVLNLPPELEDLMVDYLLLQPELIRSFTSLRVRGHGMDDMMSVAEQVEGRRNLLQFELLLFADAIDPLLADMAEAVGPGIAYHELPVLRLGQT